MLPLTNFTPVEAACRFGGCDFQNKRNALLVPLATLWLSDLFINSFLYFHTWVWLYKDSLLLRRLPGDNFAANPARGGLFPDGTVVAGGPPVVGRHRLQRPQPAAVVRL